MQQLIRKILFYVVALWAAITLNFLIPRLMPGNPVDIMIAKMSQRGPVAPETRRSLELLFGQNSNDPMIKQYVDYIGSLLRGDLGISVTFFPTPVSTVVAQALPWTVVLVGLATIITFVIGIALGTFAGWKRGTWIDALVPFTTVLQSIPYFWLALVLLWIFSARLGWFPISGGYDVNLWDPAWDLGFFANAAYYAALPALTIVISGIGGWLLGMRNMMVSTMSEDYVLTAEAKGLSPMRIMLTYAARNAVLPSIAGFAISLGFVVSGSIVMEQVFSYPGIGFTMLQAVQNNDYALMQGLFLIITLAVLGANLFVDLIYGFIDPRTRARS